MAEDGVRRSSLGLASSLGRPLEKTVDGRTLQAASSVVLGARTVMCNDGGATQTCGPDEKPDYSHVKIEFVKFTFKESHRDPAEGMWTDFEHAFSGKKIDQVSSVQLFLGGQDFEMKPVDGAYQLVVAKDQAQLPAEAQISLVYTSPMGGEYFVDNHPIKVDFGVPKASGGCCVVQ